MINLLLSLFFLVSFIVNARTQELQKEIETFFEGFHALDSIKLKSITSIPKEMKFQEKILSFSIQICGGIANALITYEFYVNEKLIHKGVNAFTLFKEMW